MQQQSIMLFFMLLVGIGTIFFVSVFVSSLNADKDAGGTKNVLKKRFWFTLILIVVLGIFAAATLPKSPYFTYANQTPSTVIHVGTMQFSFFLSTKPIDPKSPSGETITISHDQLIEFRVTSFDVNHGFAVYDPSMRLITQVQAMPGYINNLRYKFSEPGEYHIFCLEFCGTGHPVMQTTFKVI
jgi:cytochrome c oxidase subunit 2